MKPTIKLASGINGYCQCGKFQLRVPGYNDDSIKWRILSSIRDCPNNYNPNSHFPLTQIDVAYFHSPDDDDPGDPNDQGHLPKYLANFLKRTT